MSGLSRPFDRPFDAAIVLQLRPSAVLRRVAAVLYSLAFVVIATGYPAVWQTGLLLIAIALAAWRHDLRYRRPPANEVATLVLGTNDRWQLIDLHGRVEPAALVRAPLISAFMTALTFRCTDRSLRHVLLFGDTLETDVHRRLRVRLRRIRSNDHNDDQPT